MTTEKTIPPEHYAKEETGFDEFSGILLSSDGSSLSSSIRSATEDTPSPEAIKAAKIAKTSQEAKRSYETMSRYAIKHDKMNPREWCVRIMNHPTFLGLHTRLWFARILKYSTTSGPLFVFAEHTEPIMLEVIQRVSRDLKLHLSTIPPENATVTIKELMNPDSIPTSWSSIITSERLPPDDNVMVVVQYDEDHTVSIPKRVFDNIVDHYPKTTGHLSSVTIVRHSASDLQQMSMHDWKEQAMSRIEHLEEAEVSYSDSEELKQLTNRAKYENVTNILKKHDDDLMEIHQRMGHFHESVVRLRLEAIRGSEWGKSKTIFGLYDIFMFVAVGLNTTPAQRKKATTNLYTRLINGFNNWNYNPKDSELTGINFKAVTQLLLLFTDAC
jgi:hypothetical protein